MSNHGAMSAHAWYPLALSAIVTLAAGAASLLLPDSWAANAVGLLFFGATYWLVLRKDARSIHQSGLGLGGLFEPSPLSWRLIVRSISGAVLWALAACILLFPGFILGYQLLLKPSHPFVFRLPPDAVDEVVTQILAIALPEEMFYRGYLQSQLERTWKPSLKFLGGSLGLGVLVSSLVFALGHLVTVPSLTRLAVFFPSLIFGWLRSRTGGIGASVLFHAACNLLALYLGRGYGFFD